MNQRQFDFLLQQGEGFKLEFKENFDSKNLVEKVGSGISRMKNAMLEAGLLQPEIEANTADFILLFYKDIYTEENLRKMGLNERQIKAVLYTKEKGKITNREYQDINMVSNKTAYLELSELVKIGLFLIEGRGKNIVYRLKIKSNEQVMNR